MKYKERFIKTIILLLLITLSAASLIGEDIILNLNSYPPYMLVDDSDKENILYSGIIVDVFELFKKNYPEYDLVYKNIPHARTQYMAENGIEGVDILMNSPLFINPAILEFYDYSSTIVHTEDVVITRADSSFVFTGPEDLYGMKVGIMLGYGYSDFDALFDSGLIKGERVETHPQNIRKLQMGRIDAYFGNIHVSPYYMIKIGLNPDNFTISEKTLFEFDYGPFVTKRRPELLRDLKSFLERSRTNGDIERIVRIYIEN